MKGELQLKQKKEWAKTLFLSGELTQKEIAAKVDVSEKTMSAWVNNNKEKWEELKASFSITREQQLKHFYAQVNEINEAIQRKKKGERFADSKQADTLAKLTASIKQLETETSLSEVVSVFKEFGNWLKQIDIVKAKEFTALQDQFITDRLK